MSAVPCCGAVPFEEDDRDPKIWFLDHSYLEQMYRMFKKVNGVHLALERWRCAGVLGITGALCCAPCV